MLAACFVLALGFHALLLPVAAVWGGRSTEPGVTLEVEREADSDVAAKGVEVPELALGREEEPAERVSVAWVAYDDLVALQARQSVTHQPAIQAQVDPTPDAPLRSDAAVDQKGPERAGQAQAAEAAMSWSEPLPKTSPEAGAMDAGGVAPGVTEAVLQDKQSETAEQPQTAAHVSGVTATSPDPAPDPQPTSTPRSDREADPTAPVDAVGAAWWGVGWRKVWKFKRFGLIFQ